jgi:enoyl-CoA hydratase
MAVELSRVDEFALITLNRPEALNALSFAIVGDIAAALDEVAGWDVRALLITGAGERAFCAGADITELGGRTLSEVRRGAEAGQAAFAKLDLPEIKLGLIPGYGGTQRLPRLIGQARALEAVMTGRTIEALEAERIGLVNRIVEGDAMEPAMAFAREFTCFGLPALELARGAVGRALDVSLFEGLRIEADLNTLAFQTADAAEGMAAFVEKRPARFEDR